MFTASDSQLKGIAELWGSPAHSSLWYGHPDRISRLRPGRRRVGLSTSRLVTTLPRSTTFNCAHGRPTYVLSTIERASKRSRIEQSHAEKSGTTSDSFTHDPCLLSDLRGKRVKCSSMRPLLLLFLVGLAGIAAADSYQQHESTGHSQAPFNLPRNHKPGLTPKIQAYVEGLRQNNGIQGISIGVVHMSNNGLDINTEYGSWGIRTEDGDPTTPDVSALYPQFTLSD